MTWNPLALATALQTVPEQNIDVTNSENALIIKMNDYGDLQINILFTSRQMIIETFICPVSSISNPDEFNTFLLRNQKMMPPAYNRKSITLFSGRYRLNLLLKISCLR